MPTLSIEDFRHGLDVRKSPLTAVGGSLQIFTNAVLTNGGEVEKRKAFVQIGTLPAYASGLFGQGGRLHVFGSSAGPATFSLSGVPFTYHQLDSPVDYVFDTEVYGGKFWVAGVHGAGLTVSNWWDGVTIGTTAQYSRVFASKLYTTRGSELHFSSVDQPNVELNTVSSPGGGFIDVAKNDSESEDLSGLEVYYGKLAVFARYTTQIWQVDPDPALNQLTQTLRTGSIAPHAIRQFGTGDVLFLSDSGIRSLRALNVTLAAGVIDVGSPIDKLVQANVAAEPALSYWARSVVEPITGRFWLSIGGTLYVLSFFPSAKISAWSRWEVPFYIQALTVVGSTVYVLDAAGAVYAYGGLSGTTYDSAPVTIRTPHMAADKPSVVKKVQSVSGVVSGTWQLGLGMVADNTDLFEAVATLSGPSTTNHRIAARGHGTHIAAELVSAGPGPATVGSLAIQYEMNERL